MAKDNIQFMRGLEKDLPQLNPGTPAFTIDTNKLFIGNGDGNKNIEIGAKGDKGDKGDKGEDATPDAVNTHKNAATLDHPDKSVTSEKLADSIELHGRPTAPDIRIEEYEDFGESQANPGQIVNLKLLSEVGGTLEYRINEIVDRIQYDELERVNNIDVYIAVSCDSIKGENLNVEVNDLNYYKLDIMPIGKEFTMGIICTNKDLRELKPINSITDGKHVETEGWSIQRASGNNWVDLEVSGNQIRHYSCRKVSDYDSPDLGVIEVIGTAGIG